MSFLDAFNAAKAASDVAGNTGGRGRGGRGRAAPTTTSGAVDLTLIFTLTRLNTLLTLLPLASSRNQKNVIQLQHRSELLNVLNYSQIYETAQQLNKSSGLVLPAPQRFPAPSSVQSGDILQSGSGYRGVGRHFAMWLKKGMTKHVEPVTEESVKKLMDAARNGDDGEGGDEEFADDAADESGARSQFSHIRFTLEEMRACLELDAAMESGSPDPQYGEKLAEILKAYPKEFIDAIMSGDVSHEEFYWTAPTELVPPLVPRMRKETNNAAGASSASSASSSSSSSTSTITPSTILDPLLPSTPISHHYDLYLFPHLDEMGYQESSMASLGTDTYINDGADGGPQERCVDPLLAHALSQIGQEVRKVKSGQIQGSEKLASDPHFPSLYLGLQNDGILRSDYVGEYAWQSLLVRGEWIGDEKGEYHRDSTAVRSMLAEHLEWLEKRVKEEKQEVWKQLKTIGDGSSDESANTSSSSSSSSASATSAPASTTHDLASITSDTLLLRSLMSHLQLEEVGEPREDDEEDGEGDDENGEEDEGEENGGEEEE